MSFGKKRQHSRLPVRMCALLLGFCLVLNLSTGFASAEDDVKKLQNGSFESHSVTSWSSGCYAQPKHNDVPYWNTTAYNTDGSDGLIELFKENSSTYLQSPNVTLKPSNGDVAAELNADEESTLYQVVSTSPSSIYEWGLDHGARTTKDVMALVIGPAQSENPSKPSKTGRDQFMQMVDWLNSDANSSIKDEISAITAGAEPKQYTVYSKKFAASGTFADNTGNNAFSLTPSTIYTEEWHIWIMASSRSTTAGGENPWNSYGSNAEGSAGSGTSSGSTEVDTSKYYLYTVPEGQTRTLFGFVSISSVGNGPTYGNFLDNINFDIYHPLSGSTSTHGSAVVGGSDGTTEGGGTANSGHTVTVNDKLATYVTDGESLKIQAIIKKADADAGCEFVGVYYTTQDENGNPHTVFLQLAGHEIEDTGSLTDEQKKGKWIKSTNADGDIIYTYYLESITSATDLHFVFIKSPTITYDPNGGKAYVVERTYNTDEAANVYSYKPAPGHNEAQAGTATIFIDPYVSKAAEGPEDAPEGSWKFMGWLLTGDTVDNVSGNIQINAGQLGSLILPDVHTVACDYAFNGVNRDTKAQYFKIYGESVTTSKSLIKDNNEVKGVTWTPVNSATINYANVHKGLTMVAQWRWRQAFIPQVGSGDTYTNSDTGGTVEITSVTDNSDTNYNAAYKTVGKSYHAETDETITATATAKDGFTFKGWYDANGNLITTNATYSYTETQESVNTYYARFSGSVTQTYIRQVKNGDTWKDTTDDKIGTLGRYTYTDAVGMPISSTATAGTGYTFVGWYDSTGNKVADTMLINGGATISYTTTGNATYYARFEADHNTDGIPDEYQVFVRYEAGANGSLEGGTYAVYDLQPSVELTFPTPTADSGYRFSNWTEPQGVTVTNSTMSGLTAGETYTFTANFVRNDVPPVTPEGPGDPGSGDPPISPSTPVLNTEDHYSYIIGYKDGTLRPYGTITRGEVATIFFRLLTDETREAYWSQTNNYSDCNSELWCNNAISTLSSMGIIDGFEDGTFRPYAKITRAQFAKIAVGFFETTKKDYEGFFTDVSIGAWYTEYVEAAARVGLIQGFEDGAFRPNSNITRAQACVIVNRALNRKPDEEHLLDEAGMLTWVDNNPGDWFYADMQEATNSHDYIWLTEDQEMIEEWTAKLPQRDWAALEHAWSTAHSAPGGEVRR